MPKCLDDDDDVPWNDFFVVNNTLHVMSCSSCEIALI